MSDNLTSDPSPPSSLGPAHASLSRPDYAGVLDLCPEAVIVFDRDFRITYANSEAIRVSHLDPKDTVGSIYWNLRPDMRGTSLEENFVAAMRNREARRFEYFYPRLDLWVEVQVSPHGDGIAAFYRDVTSHKRLEQERDATAGQLLQVLSATPDSILVIDRNWNFTFANQNAIDLLNSGPLVGENLWKLFPGNRQEPYNSSYHRTMYQRISTEFEAFYPEPFNFWVRVLARPYREDSTIIFFSDITARKSAEVARDQSAAVLQQVFDATADSIVCIGLDWKCTYANTRAHEILGADQLVGEDLWTRFPGNNLEPFASNYRRSMQERVSTEFEAHYPDPLNIWFHVLVRPFQDGIIISSANITERKLAELDRDRAAAALGQVLEVISDAVLSIDRSWNITFLNRRGAEILAPAGTIVGANLWAQFPSALYPGSPFVEHYYRAMDDRVPSSFEAFYPAPLDGWFRIEAQPAPDGIIIFFRDITEDRRATEALRASENRYRILTELNPQLIFTSNAQGIITFANQSLLEFLGMSSPKPGKQSDWLAAVHPDDGETLVKEWVHSLRTGEMYKSQARVRRSGDGQYRWLDMLALPIREADGTVQSWLGIGTDIHDQKTAAEALAASETRYRILTDLNPQFIWLGTYDGRVSYANQRFLEYIGTRYTPNDTNDWIMAFDPRDRNRVMHVWSESVTTGNDYDVEARLIRESDGSSRWFRLRASPVRDESGAVLHWLGVAIDVHESRNFAETLHQKQLETERQRAELESIYENTPVGLALFDPVTFRYVRINDELARMLGMPKDQILGRSVLEVASGVATIGELFRQVSTGKPVRDYILEGEFSDQAGGKRTWNVNYFPVYDSDGKITAITTASLEITQQRKTEAALIQSEKLAAVGRLASSISHEINNPLEAITNLLFLIAMDHNLPAELREYVTMAQSELSRVSQIATQTLRFHRQAVARTPVTPAQLVDAVLNLYQGRLSNSTIRVQASYATAKPILCFENDIRQVLNNLIANAIDAMRSGGRLLVRAHEVTDLPSGRPGVRITIADTGHGMSSATMNRLFEPFYTTKELNGTGLGLWISRGIVERHQGRLHVRSSQHPLHHGTIFTLFLPLKPA